MVLVDDHELVVNTLSAVMGLEPDLEVVGTAASIDEAIQVISGATPDVVVMDFRLPDGDGVTGTRRILETSPGVRVVMLTGRDDPATREQAREAGCSGYVVKGARLGNLADVVRAAAANADPTR